MRHLLKIPKMFPRAFSSESKIERVPIFSTEQVKDENKRHNYGLEKLKEKQRHYQQDDGLPIFLKGGTSDRVLFYFTIGLAGFGLTNVIAYIYQSAFPKNHQENHNERK